MIIKLVINNENEVSNNLSGDNFLYYVHSFMICEYMESDLLAYLYYGGLKILGIVRKGLVPTIVQDYRTNEVLMLAYMFKVSLLKTLEAGTTWFYSRSRNELWNKGATPGNIQRVKSIFLDFDLNTILILVDQVGVTCHTGEKTCFHKKLL